VQIAAINGGGETYAYPPRVTAQLVETNPGSYLAATATLNSASDVNVVPVQHDFGKFGVWRAGFEEDYLVPMLAALRKPVVITMHSAPRLPNALVRRTVQAAGQRASARVAMAQAVQMILRDDYQLDDGALARVVHIPHGVPSAAAERHPMFVAKRTVGVSGRHVLSTFGLLSDGKGIESVIQVTPALIGRYPDLLYLVILVIGQTRPEVRKRDGERYREALLALSQALGVERHVRFIGRYLPEETIFAYLAASDITWRRRRCPCPPSHGRACGRSGGRIAGDLSPIQAATAGRHRGTSARERLGRVLIAR
jgi:polysaccharide biosynthesis protein PslF